MADERGDKFRDTMVATLVGDGSRIPPFYIKGEVGNASKASGRRPKPDKKPVKGMNIAKMIEYAAHLDKFVNRPVILVLDRLAAHKSKAVRECFESYKCPDGQQKFEILLLPAKTAFLISPCDMGFFSMWKSKFYKLDRSTYDLKILAANEVWKTVDPIKVANFFVNCGLTSKESDQSLRKRIFKQVRGGIPEDLDEVREYYEGWLAGSYTVSGVRGPRSSPMEELTIPKDSGLNGVYWVKKGPQKKEV